MRIPTRRFAIAAFALLMVAAASALFVARWSTAPRAPAHPLTAATSEPSTANGGWMPCLYHVTIIHDVHWAAACMKKGPPDDAPDCTLPNELAAVLNKAQQDSEKFCARRGA